MAAPDYVPILPQDRPRRGERLPAPGHWTASRPAEVISGAAQPTGPGLGTPGPDAGYALTLTRRFRERLVLTEREHREDAEAGCVAVALKRAATFGRAPVIHDLDHAFTLWGFLDAAPDDLAAFRRPLFEGAHHHYWDQREIVDRVRLDTLRLTPAQVRERLTAWRDLIDAS